jgi:hypothetical protein
MPDWSLLANLADMYEAAAARTRRRAPTREPDPASLAASQGRAATWEQFLPSEQRALQSASSLQAGGDYNPRDVLLSAIGAVGAPGVPPGALGSSMGKGIRAYHGSPHDFERFDLSKIGTGEGAQAYGHGLYFAENPKVAADYRSSLTAGAKPGDYGWMVDDLHHTQLPPAQRQAVENYIKTRDPKFLDEAGLGKAIINAAPAGRMYEVNINAQPEQMLPWDQALPMEHPARAAALDAIPQSRFYTPEPEATLRGTSRDMIANVPALSGERLYSALGRRLGSEPAASDVLKEAGIPGIKYLDQGSRAAGEGSSNYVMFRDDIIDIVRKYGWAGLAAFGIGENEAKAAGVENPKGVPLSELGNAPLTPNALSTAAPNFGGSAVLDAIERMNTARNKRAGPPSDNSDQVLNRYVKDRYGSHD